jgi:hypothetical protein
MGRRRRRGRIRRRLAQLAVITLALPAVAWALDEAAKRAEARRAGSASSRWLRTGADWVHGAGRGPLARRLRERRAQ